MKLKVLRINNFKGIKEFALNADGKNLSVYADNARGKTTLFDAYNWLLFGKDSLDRKNFGIKPYDKDGNEIHNLESIVEAEFIDPDMALKRIYKEKYSKKKGEATPTFDGHTTNYFVNDAEVKEVEYKAAITSIISEEKFKILSNPLHFSTSMKWEDRRKILFEMCEEIKDSDIINQNTILSALLGAIEKYKTVPAYEKVVDEKMKTLSKSMTDIPARIDELQKSLSTAIELTMEQLTYSLEATKDQRKVKTEELTKLQVGNTSTIDFELNVAVKNLNDFETKFLKQQAEIKLSEHKAFVEISKHKQTKINELSGLEEKITRLNKSVAEGLEKKEEYTAEWRTEKAKVFEFPEVGTCDKCGQALPESQVTELREKKLAEFNIKKSKNLEEITSKAMTAKAEREKNEELLKQATERRDVLETEIKASKENEATSETQIEPKLEEQPEYQALLQAKAEIEQKLQDTKSSTDNTAAVGELTQILSILDANISEINSNIAKLETNTKTTERIEALKAEEKDLAKQYQQWQKAKNLCEEFTKTKIKAVEDIINSKFKSTKWKLFNLQINGELKECCEATYNGIPYSDLNKAQTINTGLDIINTLSEHYKIQVPIFIDNAEAVTNFEPVNTQLIKLIKPPSFDSLDKDTKDILTTRYLGYENAKKRYEENNKSLRVEVESDAK